MPKSVRPETWERYFTLVRQGYDRTRAASAAGISLNTVRRFESGNPASSGHRWRSWRQAVRDGKVECPTCGRQD